MIFLKSKEEIESISISCKLLSKLHGVLAKALKPGITTKNLDKLAEEFLNDNSARSSFKGFHGYPASICTSINSCIVHGLPSTETIKEGDVVSIDAGVFYNRFHSDSAFTHYVGDTSLEIINFIKITKESLLIGIDQIKPGNRIGDIGHAISLHVKKNNYFIAEDLVGHGIGRNLHEEPEVPNFGRRGNGIKLKDGMVLAIEPMVNWSDPRIVTNESGEIRTLDGGLSAHFEHTIAIIDGLPRVLTTFDYIESGI